MNLPKSWKLTDQRLINKHKNKDFKGLVITDTTAELPGTLTIFIFVESDNNDYDQDDFKTEFKMGDSTLTAYLKEPKTLAGYTDYRFYIFDNLGIEAILIRASVRKQFFEQYKYKIEALVESIRIKKIQSENSYDSLLMESDNIYNSHSIEDYYTNDNNIMKAEDYIGVLKECNEALKKDSKNYLLYDKMGYAFMKLDKPIEAIRYFELALSIKNDDTLAYYYAGECLLILENYKKALYCFKRITELDCKNDKAFFDCGYIIFINMGNLKYGGMDEAIDYFNKAIELNNNQANYFNYRGKANYFYYYFFTDIANNSYNFEMAVKYGYNAISDWERAIELDNSLENELNIFIQNIYNNLN